jgi:hypothetical protein
LLHAECECRAVNEWIASLGKRLFSGSLTSTPAPVAIFEPQSYLQKLANPWAYTHYLLQAAEATSKLKRLQLVLAWYISGLRHNVDTWRKPFNPVLGETWQGQAAGGRIKVYFEQISHHPPIAAYLLQGPGVCMRGTVEAAVQLSMKWRGFKQLFKGPQTIEFADGDTIDFLEHPHFTVKSAPPRAACDMACSARHGACTRAGAQPQPGCIGRRE